MSVTERGRDAAERLGGAALDRIDNAVGGAARRTVIATLALVLALDTADQATIGASATQLRAAFGLSNTDIGLLTAVTGLAGAIATLPFGVLVDRIDRTHLMGGVIVTWSVAVVVGAAAPSFGFLLATRAVLGGVTAVAVPGVASLIGDWFHPAERGQIYGYVLSGELLGAGFGFVLSSGLAALSWRAAFGILALPALVVAWLVWRLPEPQRGGGSRLPDRSAAGADDRDRDDGDPGGDGAGRTDGLALSAAQRQVRQEGVEVEEDKVVTGDPSSWSLGRALRYVVSIRSNVTLIVAGSLGYFFFAGVKSFGVEFVKGQYGISQGATSVLALVLGAAAIAGVVMGGGISDRLTRDGRISARLIVGSIALTAAAAFFVPALLTRSLWLGGTVLCGAAFSLAAVNPPLDAARLDIMHPLLWGRAEAARTLVREPAQAFAPLIFGLVSDQVFGGGRSGLDDTFLVMLVPLVVGAVIVVRRRRHFPRDIATVTASIEQAQQ